MAASPMGTMDFWLGASLGELGLSLESLMSPPMTGVLRSLEGDLDMSGLLEGG